MPKETFLRLPEHKRRRVFEAAVDEFAAHRFSDSSINRIIKAAGIPRGSFYQYFDDKEDIYLYVLQEVSKEKIDIFNELQLDALEDNSFFDLLLAAMPAIISWGDAHPQYVALSIHMVQDDSDFTRRILSKMAASQDFLRQYMHAEQQRGRIRAEVDTEMLQRIFTTMAIDLFSSYCYDSHEEFMRKITALFDILSKGIMPRR